MENRREFIKKTGMTMLGASLFGCSASLHANDYNNRFLQSSNFQNGSFKNLIQTNQGLKPGTLLEVMNDWMFGSEEREPSFEIPVSKPDPSIYHHPPEDGLRVTWMGHSSVLIEIDGRRILTDPVWSNRVSPVSFAGPKRFFMPPLKLGSLPELDAVLISHDHYDHLDEQTVRALSNGKTRFFVPLGVGNHLLEWGVPEQCVKEMDWWDTEYLGSKHFSIISTPARHFSGRLASSIPTLWSSWTIIGPRHRIFFSGDTGVMPVFGDIGRKYGPFDLTMLEIGAYHENWGDIHLGPEQAVDMHLALRGKVMLPIHWCTFNLGMHAWSEPVESMLKTAENRSVIYAVPRPGQPFSPDKPYNWKKWWVESIS